MSPDEREKTGSHQWAADLEAQTVSDPGDDIYDVMLAYADAQAAAPSNTALLQTWIHSYPQFQDEMRAVSWQIWAEGPEWLRADSSGSDADNAAVIAAGQSVLASLFPAQSSAAPLTSLVAAAKEKGLSVQDLAQALQLDVPLLARLEQRLIRAASLPRRLVERMAQTLGRSPADVAAFLRERPSFAAAAHYKSQQAPSLGTQADFAALLTSSSADTREAWQDTFDLLGEDESR